MSTLVMKEPREGQGQFPRTRWTMIQRAGQGSSQDLESLCGQYWYPLYAFARCSGSSAEDAEDLTQMFIAKLIAKQWVDQAHGEDCTFRSFLLVRFKRFVKDERIKGQAQKRGGNEVHVTIHRDDAEERYAAEPVDGNLTPDRLFDRAWATALLDRALDKLRTEFADSGKALEFRALQPCLSWNENTRTYKEIADDLSREENWVKVAVNRIRRRYRKLLEHEVADTVPTANLDEEMETLHRALR